MPFPSRQSEIRSLVCWPPDRERGTRGKTVARRKRNLVGDAQKFTRQRKQQRASALEKFAMLIWNPVLRSEHLFSH